MRIALLSCGPSLPRVWEASKEQYDIALGVNGAALLYKCQYAGAFDACMLAELIELKREGGLPELLGVASWGLWRSRIEKAGLRYLSVPRGFSGRWTMPNLLAAVVFRIPKGSSSVDVYGWDMSDAPDFDGRCGHRGAERWMQERALIDEIAAERGVLVRRVEG